MSRLRTRLPTLLSIWATAIVAEAILYYFFLSRPYFRRFFSPFAAAVLIAVVAGTWRIVRPRGDADRRTRDRRARERRGSEGTR